MYTLEERIANARARAERKAVEGFWKPTEAGDSRAGVYNGLVTIPSRSSKTGELEQVSMLNAVDGYEFRLNLTGHLAYTLDAEGIEEGDLILLMYGGMNENDNAPGGKSHIWVVEVIEKQARESLSANW